LNDREFAKLRAYQKLKQEYEREKKRTEGRREAERKAAEKAARVAEAAERQRREAERRAAEEARRAAQEAAEKRRREEAERYRKEQERKAAAAKRKRDAEERTRKARERTALKRSEEVARRAREEQEKIARLRMAKAYIGRKHDDCVSKVPVGGSLPKPEDVDKCIGWIKKKGVTTCLFCEEEIKHFSFQLPEGGVVACNPCKKKFSVITFPSNEDAEEATEDDESV
jgi:hypothetical protein